MPVVTELRAVRGGERFLVFVDEERLGSLDAVGLAEFRLAVGAELTAAQCEALRRAVLISEGYGRAVRWLTAGDLAEAELGRRLGRLGLDGAAIETVTGKLRRLGFLDDAAFARRFIARGRRGRPVGERRLKFELQHKGVDRALVEAAVDEARTDGDDLAVLRRHLSERPSEISDLAALRRVVDRLQRRGFRFDHIRQVLRELDVWPKDAP